MTGNDDSTLSLIYAVIQDAMAKQFVQKNSLETKASTLIAFAGGMFALLIGARDTLVILSRIDRTFVLVSISLFITSVIFANVITWVCQYRTDPDPEALAQGYLEASYEKTQLQLVSNLIDAWKANRNLIERNAILLRLAFLCQMFGFILLGTVLFLSIL